LVGGNQTLKMSDKKISELTALTEAAAADAFPIVDDSATETKKITFSNLVGGATKTELSYLVGVTSLIQTQLNAKQASDATLTSIAALGTAADKMLYTTGVDTWAETPLTAAGRALIDDADAAAQRTTLELGTIATQAASAVSITGGSITGITDLVIADGGTGQSTQQAAINALTNVAAATNEYVLTKDTATGNAIFKAATGGGGGYATIQEEGTGLTQRTIMNFIGAGITAADDATNTRTNITLDATLNSISALGTAADKMLYTTGVDTWAETALTAFGRSLIDDADAATARTTLGLPVGFSSKAKGYRATTVQSIPNVTATKIQLNAENYDELGEFDPTTNYSFTVTTTGYYLVVGKIEYSSSVDQSMHQCNVYKNGAAAVIGTLRSSGTGDLNVFCMDIIYLAANDYLELWAYQGTGGDVNVQYGSAKTYMVIHRIS